ncbi:GHMP kinase [Adhaeribacter radiodurans]|uniref:GHMP kinase n=1 Tax=Adhaeribacter radiodurans TaxID=2745197 RepID=A0A7L7LF64_9BACT|nr:GHMP kinase [Adhaeribacter radiodurans]
MSISTPGRICLFGEHQDYLGLPVIAVAISRRIYLTGHPRPDKKVVLHLPDINEQETFDLAPQLTYEKSRDYFRSAVNVIQREERISFNRGLEATVRGNIPINSGTSSSSALLVSWINFLLHTADKPIIKSAAEIGELAYKAEILEFGEPGGMMDHYSTAMGNIIYLESQPKIHVQTYRPKLGTFVLGDSQQPKDTINILKRVKYGMLEALRKIKAYDPTFDLHVNPLSNASEYRSILTEDEMILFKSNLSDRDILRQAKQLLEQGRLDSEVLGGLLNQHQDNLRDAKKVSTPKINAMIEASLRAGALGAKINGSGGGGCMFAYAPEQPEAVVEAIEQQGGKAYIITIDEGTRLEIMVEPIVKES